MTESAGSNGHVDDTKPLNASDESHANNGNDDDKEPHTVQTPSKLPVIPPEGDPNSHSRVRAELTGGRRQLWNASLPFYMEPLRNFLFDPVYLFSIAVLPPIAGWMQADATIARVIRFTSTAPLGFFLRAVSYEVTDAEASRNMAKTELLHGRTLGLPKVRPPSDMNSAIRGSFAFICSAASDIIGALMDGKKMRKWMDSLGQLRAFLHTSGVGDELEESLMKPLWHGRLLDNMKIFNDIQEQHDHDRASRGHDASVDLSQPIKDGARLMRFATAAYGIEMIRASLDRDVFDMSDLEEEKKAIVFHTQIESVDDVKHLYIQEGADTKVLRHFIAVDHKHREVVWALRGTLSVSGALVDLQAMDVDYCGCGKAHLGIAEMASNLWDESGGIAKELLEQYDGYKLVITGHSLGAGTACLLHLKIHVEDLVPSNRTVQCYGFAPPPTFRFDRATCSVDNEKTKKTAVDRAIASCICYIHDNDCVPFLSVPTVRRLSKLLDAVDNQTEHIWFWKRFRLFWEYDKIPQELVDAVLKADLQGKNVADEGEMLIPSTLVIWIKKAFTGKYEAFGCQAAGVAAKNIFICNDMMTDHLPEQYEDSLDAMLLLTTGSTAEAAS